MRRIVLEKGQVFDEALLQRTSAFNADALIAATRIVETVKDRVIKRCLPTRQISMVLSFQTCVFQKKQLPMR